MAVTKRLLTVDEFACLPQPAGAIRQELHHGRVVEFPPVKMIHTKTQKRLVDLLTDCVNPAEFVVIKDLAFRPLAEYELWVADVAVVSLALWDQTADDDYFRGVPAIVIEVLSPSNSEGEMLEREEICLRHGGQEFWIVDPQTMSVKVIRANGASDVLNRSISVSEIFA